jgi:hypothetical protein
MWPDKDVTGEDISSSFRPFLNVGKNLLAWAQCYCVA